MTALTQYERLESPGIWRPTPDGQRREVVVKFREATLVLADSRSEKPLSHWSLPALNRVNPGKMPAIYTPGEGPDESLEIDDDIMVEAIERVHRIIAARRPHPGRLRGLLLIGGAAVLGGVLMLWLPSALIGHAATVAPQAKRSAIGRAVLADLETLTGPACRNPTGEQVLSRLASRVLGRPAQIELLPTALQGARRLPGDIFVVGQGLIDGQGSGDALAGHLIAADLSADPAQGGVDPLRTVLGWAGMGASFRLLTTGNLPEGALSGYGQQVIDSAPGLPPSEALRAAFEAVQLTPGAYLASLPKDAGLSASLTAAPGITSGPILSDAEWVALQTVCGK